MAPRVVAAFDFDGTLTRHESLLPFLRRVAGRARVARALLAEGPRLAAVAAGRAGRDEAKVALLRRTIAGFSMAELATLAGPYAEELATQRRRPDVVARAGWHRSQGHELVVVSASPRLYVEPAARALGFDAALATELEVDADGRVTGGLAGANVRGPEKLHRLRAWLGSQGDPGGTGTREAPDLILWAYGDSPGDRELLEAADHPVRVGWRRVPALGRTGPPEGRDPSRRA
ncbi:MAG: HAD-IB family hydrolase [Acidimicrobiia bacterium]|nr:HAD-IB family hydrolase [Acidimicrobiia bacterium]